MRKVKPDSSSDTASQRMRPAITPEARQKQMISRSYVRGYGIWYTLFRARK